MRQITQEEFDALPIVDGRRQCPGETDYSQIKGFGKLCSFGEGCSFGEWCSFGEGCSFGEWCSFGERCSFGEWCSFGEGCSFGKLCKIFDRIFTRLHQLHLPGLYPIKLWQMAEGEPVFEAGCFHGDLAEAKARITARERHEGDAAKYTAALDALDTIAKLYN